MKKRPDHKQLIEAGNEARRILAERKVILPDAESAIQRIVKDKNAPMLPGRPGERPYLPFPWTINISRRIIYSLGRAWQADKKNKKDIDNGVEFFKYVIEGLNRPKSTLNKLIKDTVKNKKYDQKYLDRKNTLESMKRFLVDSFAIAVISKSHTKISDYLEWFLEWTNQLLKQWPENLRNIDGKDTQIRYGKKVNNISQSNGDTA